MKNIGQKIKNISFWTGLSAAVIMLLQSLGNIFGFSINEENVNNIIMSVCGVLVVLGIVNRPQKNIENTTENQIIEENSKKTLKKAENIIEIEEKTKEINENIEK